MRMSCHCRQVIHRKTSRGISREIGLQPNTASLFMVGIAYDDGNSDNSARREKLCLLG